MLLSMEVTKESIHKSMVNNNILIILFLDGTGVSARWRRRYGCAMAPGQPDLPCGLQSRHNHYLFPLYIKKRLNSAGETRKATFVCHDEFKLQTFSIAWRRAEAYNLLSSTTLQLFTARVECE